MLDFKNQHFTNAEIQTQNQAFWVIPGLFGGKWGAFWGYTWFSSL
jgi:hypothetical protein